MQFDIADDVWNYMEDLTCERDTERTPKSFVHFGSCVAAWGVQDEELSQTPDSSSDPEEQEEELIS